MSLLMDALKRAEKARQAQAAKQADGQRMSTSKLALDPLEDDNRAETTSSQPLDSQPPRPSAEPPGPPPEPPKPPPESPRPPSAEGPSTTHFSLSDDFPPTEKAPPPASPGGEKLGPFSLVRDDEMSLEDTGEMLPVVQEAERSLNRYFDESDSATTSAGPEETAGDEAATVLGGRDRAGGDDPRSESGARRTAESVFKAKAPVVARHRRDRLVIIALPLLLLVGIGIVALLFWDQLERTFFGSPQLLPPRPPQTAELNPPPEHAMLSEASKLAAAAEAASAGEQAVAPSQAAPASTETTAASEPVTGAAAGSGKTTGVIAGSAPQASATKAAAGSAGTSPTAMAAVTVPSREATLPRLPPATIGRPFSAASMGGVRISRRSKPDTIHAGINEAYLAFQSGDYARARALYAEVNRQHPNNRNALLGLGAVALRGGNYGEAARTYARLLSINPRDPIARAALINLNQRVPAGEGESHVRRLLLEDPEQSFLYYTLGNLYARQGRWVEAQQAYFDAYRLESSNADFAFNLAVSLDRLGQPAAALSYYQRALALAEGGTVSFEPRAARMRIERLKGGQG